MAGDFLSGITDWFGGGGADTGTGGGGFVNPLSSFGNLMTDVGKLAPLALGGVSAYTGLESMSAAKEQNELLKNAQATEQQITKPAAEAGATLTAAGEKAMLGGPLPPDMQATMDAKINDAKQAIRSQLANMGITDSGQMAMYEAWINNYVEPQIRENLSAQLLGEGYQGIQTAAGPAQAMAGQAVDYSQVINRAIADAMQNMTALFGSSDTKKTPAPSAPNPGYQ